MMFESVAGGAHGHNLQRVAGAAYGLAIEAMQRVKCRGLEFLHSTKHRYERHIIFARLVALRNINGFEPEAR